MLVRVWFSRKLYRFCKVRQLIKFRTVHFHPAPFTRPSFPIFRLREYPFSSVVNALMVSLEDFNRTFEVSTCIIHLTHANEWESMGKPCSCTQFILLQVIQEFVSGTTSHERWVWPSNEIEGLCNKIITTIVQSYTGKNITRLLALALLLVLCIHNNTDGNKLVISSGIASYYGDSLVPRLSLLRRGRAWERGYHHSTKLGEPGNEATMVILI